MSALIQNAFIPVQFPGFKGYACFRQPLFQRFHDLFIFRSVNQHQIDNPVRRHDGDGTDGPFVLRFVSRVVDVHIVKQLKQTVRKACMGQMRIGDGRDGAIKAESLLEM